MVDWFRVFIGTAAAINTVANVSTSRDIHSSVNMQKDAQRIAMYRNMYKDVIFSSKRTAERLKPLINDRPLLVFVVSSLLRLRFVEMGLSSEAFSEYQEKEYLANTEDLIHDINNASLTLLSPQQHDDAKRIISIVLNDGDFENFIIELKRIEDIRKISEEIKILEEQKKAVNVEEKKSKLASNKNIYWLVLIIGLVFLCGIPLTSYFSAIIFSDLKNSNISNFFSLITCVTPFIGIVLIGFGAYNILNKSQAIKKIDEKISSLRDRYNMITRQMANKEIIDALRSKFGNLSYDQAMQINKDNDDFVSQKISEDEFERYFKISSV